MRALLLLALVGCTEHGSTPDGPMPTCASLGCVDIMQTNRACPITGECYCSLSDGTSHRCEFVPLRCVEIGCDPPISACTDEVCQCPSPDGRPITLTCTIDP